MAVSESSSVHCFVGLREALEVLNIFEGDDSRATALLNLLKSVHVLRFLPLTFAGLKKGCMSGRPLLPAV